MTDRDELRDRLDVLEDSFGVGPTSCVIVFGDTDDNEWPTGISLEDITATREEPGADPSRPLEVEEVVSPHHRPPEFRGGVVCMSYADIARMYASMPDDVREAEREKRLEQGEPIPPILQQ